MPGATLLRYYVIVLFRRNKKLPVNVNGSTVDFTAIAYTIIQDVVLSQGEPRDAAVNFDMKCIARYKPVEENASLSFLDAQNHTCFGL